MKATTAGTARRATSTRRLAVLALSLVAMLLTAPLPARADAVPPGYTATTKAAAAQPAARGFLLQGEVLPVLRLAAPDGTPAADAPGGRPHRIGFARTPPPSELLSLGGDNPAWRQLADGRRVLALAIESPGARALRVGLRVQALPAEAVLRFGSDLPGAEAPVVVGAGEILRLIATNRAAAPGDPAAFVYWSPMVDGERLVLEMALPPGHDAAGIAVDIETVSHVYALWDRPDNLFAAQEVGDAGTCNNDVRCATGDLVEVGTATARITFVDGGDSFNCSGTLLNDLDPGTDFHFLTAHHCIPNQLVASTLETHWFYRSSACNAPTGDPGHVRQSAGATLLSTLADRYDTSLLRLHVPPPGGISMAGWDTSLPFNGQSLFGIHHPSGDWQKISLGTGGERLDCEELLDSYLCSASGSGHFFVVRWYDGVTEPGSSGSGVFSYANELLGTLSSSNASCSRPFEDANYASFGDAYSAGGFGAWLMQAAPADGGDIARNLSTRGQVSPGVPMHGGIVVEGGARVLITARGPTTGVADALADTTLDLYRLQQGQAPVALQTNDDWQTNANAGAIGALTANRPLDAREAALLVDFTAGSYTATARDAGDNDTGEVVLGFTVVDGATTTGTARNLSTRGRVTPAAPMHGGIVVEGSVTVLITARGPTTELASALADSTLELYSVRSGQPPLKVLDNDDWQDNANADRIGALTANRPLNALEAAVLIDLPAGSYTAIARDYDNDDSGEVVLGFTLID